MVRLDSQSKTVLAAAAELRQVSLSDLAFWNALNEPVKLTPAQRRLGAIMRGES